MSWSHGRDRVRAAEPGYVSSSRARSAGLSGMSGLSLTGAQQQLFPRQRLQRRKRGIDENVSTLPTKEHSRSSLLGVLNMLLLSPTQC